MDEFRRRDAGGCDGDGRAPQKPQGMWLTQARAMRTFKPKRTVEGPFFQACPSLAIAGNRGQGFWQGFWL